MIYNRVTYILEWNGLETEISEPINWEEDEKSFVKNDVYHGITIDVTESLKFVKDGRDLLINALETDGPNANVKITRMEADPQTDVMEVDYVGYADFNTYDIGEDIFSIKLNTDPLVTRFKSKLSSQVELERLTSLKGTLLPTLNIESLYLAGRAILITSKWAQSDPPIMSVHPNTSGILPGPGPTSTWNQAISIIELGDQNDGLLYASSQIDNEQFKDNSITIDQCFLLVNLSVYDLTYHINLIIDQSLFVEGNINVNFKVRIVITENELSLDYFNEIVIYNYDGLSQNIPKELYISWNEDLILLPGQAATLQYSITGTQGTRVMWEYPYDRGIGGDTNYQGVKGTYINSDGNWATAYYKVSLSAQEDSERKPSNSPCIRIYDVAKRLNDICVEAEFKSDLLANADIADTVVLHGMWLRGLYAGVKNYKPISTTLKDFLASLNAIYPIGVDIVNGEMIIEGRDYFYQNFVTIDLGEVSELFISPSGDDYMTSIEVGPIKSGAYEEAQGLDEPNRKTQYDTILDKTENVLDLTHTYKTDTYGLESIRRDNPDVGLQVNPDDDSKFDDDKWFVDSVTKRGQTALEVGSWEERFAVKPVGVYSAETSFNFWYSPINIMLRHGRWIKPGLLHYLNSFIAYNSSDGNSALETQLIGGKKYVQNVGIEVNNLDQSKHKAKIAKFKAKVSWKQLNGKTNGIPNRNGQIQFTRFGIKYRSYLENVRTKDGIGEFEVKLATSTDIN